VNPTRIGFIQVLRRMGAEVEIRESGTVMGEPVGDLAAWPSQLEGTEVSAAEIPSLIDEIPLLAVLASRAVGETVFRGVGELRVKESDRLNLLAENLRAVGATALADTDTLVVAGSDRPPRGHVNTGLDHRMTMAFAVLGTVPKAHVELSEHRSPEVSYPAFHSDLQRILYRG
jgi:3-phosphoshikimate 1-carboxyvinyltransferase